MASPNFISQHISNIEGKIAIHPRLLEKGMIAEVIYTKIEKGNPITKKYLILVLQPLFQGYMHVLKLQLVSPLELINLAKSNGLIYSKRVLRMKKLNLSKILMDKSSQQFYTQDIKRILNTKLNNSYRKFDISRVQSAQLIEYKFPKSITIIEDLD